MSEGPVVGMDGLAALRSAFDGTFVAPPQSRQERDPVIQTRLGGEVFAVRAAHIAGLVKSRKIVPLPSRIPELLGVSALLGIPPAVSGPSWFMLAPGETPIGLAFDGFEGRQEPEWLSGEPGERQHVHQLVRIGSAVRAVLDIPGITEAISQRAGIAEPAKEKKQ